MFERFKLIANPLKIQIKQLDSDLEGRFFFVYLFTSVSPGVNYFPVPVN